MVSNLCPGYKQVNLGTSDFQPIKAMDTIDCQKLMNGIANSADYDHLAFEAS